MSYKSDNPETSQATTEYTDTTRAPDGYLESHPAAVDGSAVAQDGAAVDVDGVSAPLAGRMQEAVPEMLREMDARITNIDGRLSQLEAQVQYADPTSRSIRVWAPRAPWLASLWRSWFQLLAIATTAIVIFLRIFRLDDLQAEIYGDIMLIYEYLIQIRNGEWPTAFTLSAGPLYHYLIMPIIALTGPTYFGMKLASAVVSLGALAATYALGRRLIDDRFALLAVFIAGVSSWLLVFSRLGNSQILVPLLTVAALWLAARVAQTGRTADVVACAAVAALGLYTYPQSFVLPAVIGFTLLCLRWTGLRVSWAHLRTFTIVTLFCAVPFVWIVTRDPDNFISGYIGGKIQGDGNMLQTLFQNIIHALLALHVRGDGVDRSNPPMLPHLDWISGLLFLGGLVFWLRPERRRWSPLLLVPLVLLQVPSMLVLRAPDEVPSASRTLGVAPIAYILVASGLWWLVQAIQSRGWHWRGLAVAAVLLPAILALNAQRYFQAYFAELPYQNTPVGRIITTYVDSLPPDTQVYLVGCCWEYGMPEPNSIQYAMARPDHLHLISPDSLDCNLLQFTPQPAVFIWSFHTDVPTPQLTGCRAWLPGQMYSSSQGLPVFLAAPLRRDLALDPALASAQPPQSQEQLETEITQLDGRTIQVLHSPLDIGSVNDLFDGSTESLIRGRGVNPLVLELHFGTTRVLSTLGLTVGSMQHFVVKVDIVREDGTTSSFTRDFQNLPDDPSVELPIADTPQRISQLRIEINDQAPTPADGAHIHVRELRLR